MKVSVCENQWRISAYGSSYRRRISVAGEERKMTIGGVAEKKSEI